MIEFILNLLIKQDNTKILSKNYLVQRTKQENITINQKDS